MKQLFTLFSIFLFSHFIQAQCTDLFFSEYVEGWSNNKALEIYNPTNENIDLSAYSISRYSNGGTSPSTTQLTGNIEPYSTFVVGLDKRNPDGEGYEAPMWDGYYTYIDSTTNEAVTIYDADTDLQSKVDLFINPIYYFGTNADSSAAFPTSLYFNGNDAITLEMLGSGIVLDLIGKVGEDPGAAWSDDNGNYWTKDHTLIRKAWVNQGVSVNPTIFDPTLEWDSLPANTFVNLGFHDCDCNVNSNLIEHQNTFIVAQKEGIIKVINNSPINYIKIYDINGKIVFQKTINQLSQIEIDKKQEHGIYFISLIDTNGIKTKSIVLLDE
jgi:hypothetical protein